MAKPTNNRKCWRESLSARNPRRAPFAPPLEAVQGPYPLKLVAKDQTLTLYLQGRKVLEEPLPPGSDPWLAIHQQAYGRTGVKNPTLKGTPNVPRSLELSALPDLSGWLADYYQEKLDGENPAWLKKGEEIVGANIAWDGRTNRDRWGNEDTQALQRAALRGSKQESLLQYHRPMVED